MYGFDPALRESASPGAGWLQKKRRFSANRPRIACSKVLRDFRAGWIPQPFSTLRLLFTDFTPSVLRAIDIAWSASLWLFTVPDIQTTPF